MVTINEMNEEELIRMHTHTHIIINFHSQQQSIDLKFICVGWFF